MSESTGYPTCSRTHTLGRWTYIPPPPLPFLGSFQIGLRFHCLRVGFKVTPTGLKQLDPIHHQGLRITLGAFHTPPVHSLYVETHEPALSFRRLKVSMSYAIKFNYCPTNPAYSYVFEPHNAKLFEKSQFITPPLGLQMLPHCIGSGRGGWCLDLGLFLYYYYAFVLIEPSAV